MIQSSEPYITHGTWGMELIGDEMPLVEDEELQAAKKAYEAFYNDEDLTVVWEDESEDVQEQWRKVVISVVEFVDLRRK